MSTYIRVHVCVEQPHFSHLLTVQHGRELFKLVCTFSNYQTSSMRLLLKWVLHVLNFQQVAAALGAATETRRPEDAQEPKATSVTRNRHVRNGWHGGEDVWWG